MSPRRTCGTLARRCAVLAMMAALPWFCWAAQPVAGAGNAPDRQVLEAGRRLYTEGKLPSGELISGTAHGDIPLTGAQAICGACHRRSGLGSMEGQEVVPAVTGDILYRPLRLPTSNAPAAPMQRPAYTDETLKRAIRSGIGADGQPLSPFMPRYPLADEALDSVIAYLKSLNTSPDPGVTDTEIHFATIVSDSVDPEIRKAFLDVFELFIAQKNSETRHETYRANNAPWHKKWLFEPYRKWVFHVWELNGPPASWPAQLQAHYDRRPVFAVLSGLLPGSWQPAHDFCEHNALPCLFPTTDLPVVDERSFYTVYLSRGMSLEADAIARHLSTAESLSRPVVQVYREADQRGTTAARQLRHQLEVFGAQVTDFRLPENSAPTTEFWSRVRDASDGGTIVPWLEHADLGAIWSPELERRAERIYLSTTLYGVDPTRIPRAERDQVYFVHPFELPGKLPRLLARSTGWLRAKRKYVRQAQVAQANAYFSLKMAGEAVIAIRGFFVRDYLIERIESMVDRATYTSVYPRMSLAPGQRFVSKGAYIAQSVPEGAGDLVAVTGWLIPDP